MDLALYAACVDFELRVAALTGLTYNDVNALLFFVLWPLVTVGLAWWVLWQRRALRQSRSQGSASEPR